MNENEANIPEKSSKWIHITVTQLVCVAIILLSVLVTKFFFKDTYSALQKWYNTNIRNETDITEVLKDGGANEI
jgi:hypothetical protein